MLGWMDAISQLNEQKERFIIVTVIKRYGSTPREAGAKMVVTSNAVYGTVGGGSLEFVAIEKARDLLDSGQHEITFESFSLSTDLGQCCGGKAELLFEPVSPYSFHVSIFGAGHVGKALIKVLGNLPCEVTWIDSRSDQFPASVPSNVRVLVKPASDIIDEDVKFGSYVVIMTHDHTEDFKILDAIASREDLPYLGVIGSKTKKNKFYQMLDEAGVKQELIQRVKIPVGINGITSKLPEEIAVSVAAELLKSRDENQS
jgi:xanthine dehydrogenase accessory factor